MKRLIGLAAFAALLSVSAQAQTKAPSVSGSSPITGGSYSGGGGSGGLGSGSSGRLPSYPPAQFRVNAVSGTQEAFSPSTFLTYDQAIAAGKAALASTKTLAEIAAENSSAQKAKAKVAFVQDAHGNIIAVPQQ